MKPSRNYHDDLIHDLKNPEVVVHFLNATLESGDKDAFLLALKYVAEAWGGMTKLARASKLHRVSLYKIMSKKGNPGIDTVMTLLDTLGIQLQLVKKKSKSLRRAA